MEVGEEEESIRVRESEVRVGVSLWTHVASSITCPILLHIIGHGLFLLLFLVKVFIRRNNVHGFKEH